MDRFAGKTAFVTGASRGIGRAIALRLAAEGADVAVHYRERRGEAIAVAEEIQRLGRGAEAVPGDVRKEEDARMMVESARKALGVITVWINNAGVEYEEPLADISLDHWDETFAVNVKGVFLCSRAAGDHMLAHGGGVIVNIASRFGFLGDPTSLPYGASKAAVVNMTKALAKHYAPRIRVNGVAPAYTPTELMAHASEDYIARFNAATPMARVTTPEDTAAAVAFLASDEASFTTGATLLVDGGYSLK